ncbi:MAG: fibronectin type III domain-containing protein, partial [Firmicutes bacterium]|nr:fibronectin type III domain-containing protein [Bacillota bacterium]
PGHAKGDVISLDALEVVGSSDIASVYYMDICGQPTRWDGSLCEGDGPYTDPLPVGNYDVALIADNGDGETATIVAVEPLTVTAPTIKNFVTEAGYTSVKLSWDAFDGAEKYTVQIFDENATEVYMKNIFGTSVNVKGLDFAANYTVAIKAMNGKTRLSPLSTYNFTTKAYSTVEVSAVASTTNVKLVWNAVDGAAKYRVAQKIDGAWVAVKDTYDTAVYVKGLDAGTDYEFAVMPIAADKSRMAASYDDVSIATATAAAATINVTVTKKNDTMAVAKWDAVEGAAKYQIAVNGVIVKVTPLTASWVTGLVEGDVIGVRAVDANNSPLCEYSSYTF